AMEELYAKGDLVLERVADRSPAGTVVENVEAGPIILAEREASGHRHAVYGLATRVPDDPRARDRPPALDVAHAPIQAPSATLHHEEYGTLTLPKGTYRVRRQRESQPQDARIVVD